MPKKRAPTGSEADPAPRRSGRACVKTDSLNLKSVAIKSTKPNGAGKKSKTAQAPSTQTVDQEDNADSLTGLSAEGDDDDDHVAPDVKLPPQKKPKLEKSLPSSTQSASLKKNKLAVGEKFDQEIILKNHEDVDVNLRDLFAEKGTIMFIYPKSNTPGCTVQACGYRDIYKDIEEAGYQVVGLSMDSPKSQTSWKQKQKLPYMLLCDPKQQLIKLLGSSKSSTSVQRSHFIFEAGGKLLDVDAKASTTTSPKEALEFITALSNGATEVKA